MTEEEAEEAARQREDADGLSTREYNWIGRVVQGATWDGALGALETKVQRRRDHIISERLGSPSVRRVLIARLLVAGQVERAQEALRYAATLALSAALDEGDVKVALSLMGKSAKPSKAASPALPDTAASADDSLSED